MVPRRGWRLCLVRLAGGSLGRRFCELREQGIESLVSLLSAEEVRVLRLEDGGAGLPRGWHRLPVVPGDGPFDSGVDGGVSCCSWSELQRDLRAGKGVGAHCFAGIGRSCMLMAGLLCAGGIERGRGVCAVERCARTAGSGHLAAERNGSRILPSRWRRAADRCEIPALARPSASAVMTDCAGRFSRYRDQRRRVR